VARHTLGPRSAAPAPLLLLLAYGVAFASHALGRSTPAFDDHPGQLYRIWHVVTLGPAPWAWNWGWWTGYPELQFYPPGFAYAGALLHAGSLGALTVDDAYVVLVWLAYLAPGVIAWLALARALGNGWLALPGAFVVLTLSLWPGLASGVEGGVHVGMAPARLGWALIPLLALALARWSDGEARFPIRSVVPLIAAIVLVHPAHLPAALVLVALASVAGPGRTRRAALALGGLGVAALVTAFWTVPLLARLEHTRALAWGVLTPETLVATFGVHPLAIILTAGALAALWHARSPYERVLARAPWVLAVVVGVDAVVLEPRGLAWLPADRVMDGVWLTLTLSAGVSAGRLVGRLAPSFRVGRPVGALVVIAAVIAVSLLGRDTLTLWPRAGAWPTHAETERGLRLPALWSVLRGAPEGRVLFVRSGVPLVYGPQWWRPHTHVTALTPLTTGRAIVNGTFTHPSPVGALLYRGDAGRGPITRLVEQLDGHALFGRPLESLDAEAFNAHARRLGVSVVVALDEDFPRLTALTDNPLFPRRQTEPPFIVWLGAPSPLPHPLEAGPWRLPLATPSEGWTSLPVAYYPLWRATAGGVALETRRGPFAELEVRLPAGASAIDLDYRAGPAEWTGVALTAVGLLAWLVTSPPPRPRRRTAGLARRFLRRSRSRR
jgi:hypothetical protein